MEHPNLVDVCHFIGLTPELCVSWTKTATLYCEKYVQKYGERVGSSSYKKALGTSMAAMDSWFGWFGWGLPEATEYSHLHPNQLTLDECLGLQAKYGATTEQQVGDNLTSTSLENVIWCILIAIVSGLAWGVSLSVLHKVFRKQLQCLGRLRAIPLQRLIPCLVRGDYLPFEVLHDDMWNLQFLPAGSERCDCEAHRKEVRTLVVKRLPNMADLFPDGCTRTLVLKVSAQGYAVEMLAMRKADLPMPLYRKYDSAGEPFSRLTMREAFRYIDGDGDQPYIHVLIVFDGERKQKAKAIKAAAAPEPLQKKIITGLMDLNSSIRLADTPRLSHRSQSVERPIIKPRPQPSSSTAAGIARSPTSPLPSPRRNAFQHVTAKVNTNLNKKPKGDAPSENIRANPSPRERPLRSKSQDVPKFRNY